MSLAKAYFQTETGKKYDVQFNPETFSLSKSADWTEKSGDHTLDLPLVEWKGGKAMKLEMTLLFDTHHDDSDVREITEPIEALSLVDSELHHPPTVKFVWGGALKHWNNREFRWLLTAFNTNYKMFTEEGKPVRAEMKVTLTEFATQEEQKNHARLQSPDHEKVWRVQPGDTLQSIAFRAYEDPTMWRPIAQANQIDDPRDLVPGAVLRVPRIR